VTLGEKEVLAAASLLEKGETASEEDTTANDWVLEQLSDISGTDCNLSGFFEEDLGVDYIVSEKMLQNMVKHQVLESAGCQVYVTNPKTAAKEFQKEAEKYRSQVSVSVVQTGKEQLIEYRQKHGTMLQGGKIIVVLVGGLSIVMLYLAMKSHVMQKREEITAYLLVGISFKNIIRLYRFEMFWMSLRVCVPVVGLSSLLLKIVAATPSFDLYLYFPWWLVAGVIVMQMMVNMEVAGWAVKGFLFHNKGAC
jgi:ABC-type antimicrobial peptide transport system permease subunit